MHKCHEYQGWLRVTTLLVSFYFIKLRYEKALTLLLGLIVMLAERTGLEPATPGVTGRSLFNQKSNISMDGVYA